MVVVEMGSKQQGEGKNLLILWKKTAGSKKLL